MKLIRNCLINLCLVGVCVAQIVYHINVKGDLPIIWIALSPFLIIKAFINVLELISAVKQVMSGCREITEFYTDYAPTTSSDDYSFSNIHITQPEKMKLSEAIRYVKEHY